MNKSFLLLLLVLAFAGKSPAQKTSEPSQIAVNGQAEVMVVPDEVAFKLTAENINLDVNKA